jgi:dihydrolipoamide dehydrogenase
MNHQYDIVVLGGGIGGYTAAIRAAQLGRKTAIVEKDKLGGTCLHRGCIPSKSLLRSAEVYHTARSGETFGIRSKEVTLDFARVQERKAEVVAQLYNGVQYLMKKNKIDVYRGHGRIVGPSIFSPKPGSVAVEKEDGEVETLISANLIIATGSSPRTLPGLEIDGKCVLTSDEALQLEELPKSMLIVGGGVIGVEWASLLNDFGVDVTIAEYEDRLVPLEDDDVSRELARLFKKRGIRVMTGAQVLPETLEKGAQGLAVSIRSKNGSVRIEAEKMLVSVGRQANLDDIGIENTNVKVEKGYIRVNERMQTSEPHIYAVGDVNGGLQLAHAASHEGVVAAEQIAGLEPSPSPAHLIPRCIYTRPEMASIGWTEKQARELGYEVEIGVFSFKSLGKALVSGDTDGFIKVVADRGSNDLLGVHMIGPHVTDSISEAGLAHVLNATPWEVSQTIHPHPSMAEALFEAMLAVQGKALNI